MTDDDDPLASSLETNRRLVREGGSEREGRGAIKKTQNASPVGGAVLDTIPFGEGGPSRWKILSPEQRAAAGREHRNASRVSEQATSTSRLVWCSLCRCSMIPRKSTENRTVERWIWVEQSRSPGPRESVGPVDSKESCVERASRASNANGKKSGVRRRGQASRRFFDWLEGGALSESLTSHHDLARSIDNDNLHFQFPLFRFPLSAFQFPASSFHAVVRLDGSKFTK